MPGFIFWSWVAVSHFVMPGLAPGIHVLKCKKGVDGRDKPGHDKSSYTLIFATSASDTSKLA